MDTASADEDRRNLLKENFRKPRTVDRARVACGGTGPIFFPGSFFPGSFFPVEFVYDQELANIWNSPVRRLKFLSTLVETY